MNKMMFNSKDIKAILKLSDCELMHMRTANLISAVKKGNAYFYELPNEATVLNHPVGKQLINWYKQKHDVELDNWPNSPESLDALERLVIEILLPIYRKHKNVKVTYGFTSYTLKSYISKYFPKGTAPHLDQHAACELNSKQNKICEREGAACDFFVPDFPSNKLVCFVVEHLNFDRIYYYGKERPIHVSTSHNPNRHLQVMVESKNGRRYPSNKAYGEASIELAKRLL